MKNSLVLLMILFMGTAFTQTPKTKEITFRTSAVCGMCKERIEDGLNYTKGVIFAELDLETKEVTVKYRTKYLTPKEVKQIVADLGYDAGDVPRNKKKFEKLPKCCKSEGFCRDK
ncbi:MAG: heavy metal-associated domain-containing protein [Crocinitomicaceae bacterium]